MSHKGTWTFLTNHGAVLSIIGQRGCITIREIAATLQITERSVNRILKDLLDEGYVSRMKKGKLNCYEVNENLSLRHTSHQDTLVGELLASIKQKD
jgi:predicted transcriptional regulator